VVVTHIAMPAEDGHAFLLILRSFQRGHVPVSALSITSAVTDVFRQIDAMNRHRSGAAINGRRLIHWFA